MWWQTLPPLAIMGGCVAVMYGGQGLCRYLWLGQPLTRTLSECTHYANYQKIGYCRDLYMVGDRYHGQGFEALSDD